MKKLDSSYLNNFLQRKFPTAKKSSSRGAKPIGAYWCFATICIIVKMAGITWRELPSKLETCKFLITEGYLTRIPHYSTFNRYWSRITVSNLETWISQLGYQLSKTLDTAVAIPSSGFKMRIGKIWRFVKWDKKQHFKSS